MTDAAPTRLGVLGWPVGHSRSPAMHNAALREMGLPGWHYQLLPAAPDELAAITAGLPGAGFRGANVTIPHKVAALELCDSVSAGAGQIGAVNTLTFEPDGSVRGDNTDAPGFLASLPQSPAAGSTAMVLGAGGVAAAVVWALRSVGVDVSIWNRTGARAVEMARLFDATAVDEPISAGMLVNCTSAGLSGDPFETLPLKRAALGEYSTVADLVYHDGDGPLLLAAAEAGAATVDGIEVLVQQGALALQQWTGAEPPVEVMRQAALSA